MALDPELSNFVRDALQRGMTRDQTGAALSAAGWTETEIAAALDSWIVVDGAGPVPRPVRSSAAADAVFYALLFLVFAAIVGNVLALWFGQIDHWFPDDTETLYPGQQSGLRWSIAALVVFLPVFLWLDRTDSRATARDPSLHYNSVRRWLSAIALLCALLALLTDALFLIYRWLDGQLTLRFLLKSATVAGVALITLAYFRSTRRLPLPVLPIPAGWIMAGLGVLGVGLTLLTIGGPSQGRAEQRDQSRIAALYTLSSDLDQCPAVSKAPLPAQLDPMDCATNPGQMARYAAEIRYARLAANRYSLCIDLENAAALYTMGLRVEGNTVCQDRSVD